MVGKVKRTTIYKEHDFTSPVANSFFSDFVSDYRYCHANKPAETASVAKYDHLEQNPDPDLWSIANKWNHLALAPLRGSQEVSYDYVVSQLDHTTSPGYPWSLRYNTKSDVLALPSFRDHVEKVKNMVETQDIDNYVPLWTSSVKAELRPLEKALANKLRTYCAGPVELTALTNLYP